MTHKVTIHILYEEEDVDSLFDKCIDFFEKEIKIKPENFTMGSEPDEL